MGIIVEWDNPEETILIFKYEKLWTWDDFHSQSSYAKSMSESVDHPVHQIVCFHPESKLPPNAINHARSITHYRPQNIGKTIIAGAPVLMRTLSQIVSKIYPDMVKGYQFVDTMDEARALLKT